MLVGAAMEMSTVNPGRARDTLLEAVSAAQVDGWFGPEYAEAAQAARRLPRAPGDLPGAELLDGYAAIQEGRTADGYALLRKGVRSMAAAHDAADNSQPRVSAWLQAAGLTFDYSAWTDLEEQWIPALCRRGEVTTLILALFSLGFNHLRAGRLTAAETALAESRSLAEGAGYREFIGGNAAIEVWLLGFGGKAPEGRALAARLLGEQLPQQWLDFIHLGIAVLELGACSYAPALDAALEARGLWRLLSPEDVVEAAVRCGRPQVGQAAFADFVPVADAAGTSWVLGVKARCRALLAGDSPGADEDYQQSITYLKDTPVVFALARSRLVYGEWLRRQRRRRDARDQLRAALESFERMGAHGFAGRARSELEAAGEHAVERARSAGPLLTPQEAQIARLAAAGVPNRDIATRLFLSTATVDYHLRKVYRKLGVTRRASLGNALLDAGREA